ncbi:unnamed protein product [Effrenium voratum]|nr:unnamed protein product [Effrenium voratum]
MEEKEEAQEVALRGRLREAAAASEEAERELTAREAERAKLLELLEFKETRLQRQSLATRRLRDALGAAKGCAAYYLARTAVRGWRQLLRFGEARRGLERAKERRAELAIRQGCGLMRAALCRAVGRRRQAALHGLWLHAAGQRLQEDFEEWLVAVDNMLSGEKDELTRQAVHEGGRSGLGLVAIQVPEDQVLFGTPRKKEEAKSPSHLRSPFSEASTRATRTTASLRISAPVASSAAGAARLGLALGKALVFRLGFAWRRVGQARDKRRAQLLLQQQEDWRQGAEQRLVELAKKGQRAERQREALRQKCQAAQQGCGAAERRAARLRTQLAEAEQPYPWPFDGDLRPENTALLAIDMQTDFCGKGGYVDSMGYDISMTRAPIEPLKVVFQTLRRLRYHIIHTREGHRPSLADCPANKRWRSRQIGAGIGDAGPCGRVLVRGEVGWNLIEELKPAEDEEVIDKPGKGSFVATDLDLILKQKGIRNLILTGITTDVCVSTTMREANDLGYECLLLSDCTAATDYGNYLATLKTTMQSGGVFGCVAPAKDLLRALGREVPSHLEELVYLDLGDGLRAMVPKEGTMPRSLAETMVAPSAASLGAVEADPYAWPFEGRLSPESTALLAIDLQKDFLHPEGAFPRAGFGIATAKEVVSRSAEVLRAMRAKGFHVLHARVGSAPSLADCTRRKVFHMNRSPPQMGQLGPLGRCLVRGEPGWDFMEEVVPLEGEPVVDKPGMGAFSLTSLELTLHSLKVKNLVLVGVTTDVCVHTTLRQANDRGFECLLLSDCCGAAFPELHFSALKQVKMQHGVFGAVAESAALLRALELASQTASDCEAHDAVEERSAAAPGSVTRLLGSALSRRAKQLERAASATPPRGVRLKRAKEERLTSLAKARQEVRRLRLALHEARSAAPGEHELCRDLRAGWQRERDQWAEACEELRRRTASAQDAARAARHAEAEAQAEATAAKAEAEAQVQLDPELRRLKSQLEGLCSQAAKAKGDLEAHVLEGTPDAEGESQSEEVAAYEALVSRLRSELRWEKSQRMACDQALETLRGSYGLLLSRAAAR